MVSNSLKELTPGLRFESLLVDKMLMYQWMLIPSMPVAGSLKRWFESNHQYGSVYSRVQLENRGNTHFKWRLQDVKPFIKFWSIKTFVLWRWFNVKNLHP